MDRYTPTASSPFLMGEPMTDKAAVAREKARQEKNHHKRVARHRRELLIEIRNLLREEPYREKSDSACECSP